MLEPARAARSSCSVHLHKWRPGDLAVRRVLCLHLCLPSAATARPHQSRRGRGGGGAARGVAGHRRRGGDSAASVRTANGSHVVVEGEASEVIERVKGLRTNTFTPIETSVRELLTLAKSGPYLSRRGKRGRPGGAREERMRTSHETCVVCSDDFVRGDILRVRATCPAGSGVPSSAGSAAARGTAGCVCSAAL